MPVYWNAIDEKGFEIGSSEFGNLAFWGIGLYQGKILT